jgi:hypothetical protein
MTVSVSLALIGTDEEPRWATDVIRGRKWSYCCHDGHYTPEAAASHGAELAAAYLSQYARSLQPPACGALALQKAQAA